MTELILTATSSALFACNENVLPFSYLIPRLERCLLVWIWLIAYLARSVIAVVGIQTMASTERACSRRQQVFDGVGGQERGSMKPAGF